MNLEKLEARLSDFDPAVRRAALEEAAAGFASVRWENLSFGIACLHFGERAA